MAAAFEMIIAEAGEEGRSEATPVSEADRTERGKQSLCEWLRRSRRRNPAASPRCLGVARFRRSVRANRTVLVAREARPKRERKVGHRVLQRLPHDRRRGIQQDRADRDSAIGDDSAVTAHKLARIEVGHHLGSDSLEGLVALCPLGFGSDF